MGHAPPNLLRPRRIAASLALGLATSLALSMLLATVLLPSHWTSKTILDHTKIAPTYLAPIAPDLVEAFVGVPAHYASGEPLLGGSNLGVDMMVFSYGASAWSATFQPWDPLVTPEPTNVELTRFRFGWPMRMLSMDDITTGASTNISLVRDYHQRAYALAAADRGLNRPAWIPRVIPLHRIPIAVNWTGLAVNTACWSAVCFLLLSCRPLIQSHIRRRRTRRGLCPTCRYELQSLPTCPECGQPNQPAGPPQSQQPVASA